MKGVPVLHWPKLFEGWMLTGEYRHHGDGELTGDGLGGGYIGGAIARRGDGRGGGKDSNIGIGNGYGDGNGNGNGNGDGDGVGCKDGNGWSRKSV
jgi:hypothetical protein